MNDRTLDPATLTHLQTWLGKTELLTDDVQASALRRWHATLDHAVASVAAGTSLPPLSHWLYFLPQHLQSEVGADGHARTGGFLPPVPLPRRMWAGSQVRWEPGNPMQVGDAVQRQSHIASVQHKAGRTGDLVFVQVVHAVHNARGLALTETQDLVYRAVPQAGDPVPAPTAAERNAPWQRDIRADEALLFRYSALTFNGHRIHYDRPYATEIESYPGLVVHGPLIATLLLDLVRRHAPQAQVLSFQFKAVRPIFDVHAFTLCGRPSADGRQVLLWAHDHEGWLTMQASAELA